MSGSGTADGLGADFAELLRELKERSGLSYGVLAKRLHMSTSTLHRYCNGDAVPTDYAPVERLARLCKASPEELVELHRTWVLADARRRRKGSDSVGEAEGERGAGSGSTATAGAVSAAESGSTAAGTEVSETLIGGVVSGGAGPRGPARRRTRVALVAGVAVAAVLGAVTLAMSLPSGGKEDGAGRTAGAASVDSGRAEADGKGSASPTGASPSVSASETGGTKGKGAGQGAGASATATPTGRGGAGAGGADASLPVPLNVKVEPYTWEDPCSQRYLADRTPARVAPPPLEQDAPAWVSSEGAVASGEQFLTLTVQGTGEETVVVRSLKVRMTDKRSPLAWNDYAMGYPGVGCGAGVPTRSFTIALDAARPAVQPKAGSRNFPYSVSQSDPEVFYVTADASAYYVSWYLELEWTAGSRSGTLRLDDDGRPFRTSGNNGRPAYEYPIGGPKWVPEGATLREGGDGSDT
ncbi:helix-turn-helix transcriptional regulator [Streptomyces caniscabiei]|uniref:helix-turn-helix domain-containing protein n=1 Tax=Streptomyces caniscabiei TaxID=2746961 RepID=UPI0023DB2FB9|nr:helix-turn-helix transcriptional regulator [Streptomyces caniscabiei]MDX3513057.1 helix-turn-helix transcriptional regulator [Streptomyces caniscabiei]MDX3722095.1 helix-turn-helix transcriptional regulator [Streptomyces caniscabiei]MDX3732196.1 helix-turn-helix transcriptional regulator [Streptomyces caniscabiei]WEO25036.1 helix-turn-helix transcriptional regulator [Streptomyces caniscabiei]